MHQVKEYHRNKMAMSFPGRLERGGSGGFAAEGVLNQRHKTSVSELSGEAGAPAKRDVAMPVEGVLNPNDCP